MSRRFSLLLLLPFVLAAGAAEARSKSEEARLRHCGDETCVVLAGVRAEATDAVIVAGHEVEAQGGRRFEVVVKVGDVRAWSAPFARTIAVATVRPNGEVATREVRLPVGLLGHVTELASLEVSAR